MFFFFGAYFTMKVLKKRGQQSDSDMALTYDAFQIIVKQMMKAVKK